jgi:hypothetical protein
MSAFGPLRHRPFREAALIGAAALIVLAVLSSRDVHTLRHELPEPRSAPVEESVA